MMQDLILNKQYSKGNKGKKVKLIQEWLCLHKLHLAIDGDFGPATDYAVKAFQKQKGLTQDGIVEENTFALLTKPMTDALAPIAGQGKKPGSMVVAYAKQHLRQHPLEIGGQNKGPWVRLYMEGNEGPSWPWCAGFACFILKQAFKTLELPLPVQCSFSCDSLAASAKEKNLFLDGSAATKNQITPGSIFLNRRTSTDWVHTGIVLKAEDNYFHTIEGNTNDEGSREGYEVCQRIRGYKDKDFILI
jgi:hypothetical protein